MRTQRLKDRLNSEKPESQLFFPGGRVIFSESDPVAYDDNDFQEAKDAFVKAFIEFVDSHHAEFNYEVDVFGDEYEHWFDVYLDNSTCVTVRMQELFEAYEKKHFGSV